MRELSALIVEDDVASAFQVERILVQQGFVDINRVKSVEAAAELLDSIAPQLALARIAVSWALCRSLTNTARTPKAQALLKIAPTF